MSLSSSNIIGQVIKYPEGIVIRNSKSSIAHTSEPMGVARGGGHGGLASPQSTLYKNKDLGNHDEHLPLRNCFQAGLLISGLTKEKYNTTLLFVMARVVMAQPQWLANGQASLLLFKTNLRWHIIFTELRIT